jgi:hypothetical protein
MALKIADVENSASVRLLFIDGGLRTFIALAMTRYLPAAGKNAQCRRA